MLSIYIHIPFCTTKCNYCNFQVCPLDKIKTELHEEIIENYLKNIINEIKNYSNLVDNKRLKTLYFWWGTPSLLGIENIIKIINTVFELFDIDDFEELSIECNPYPQKNIYYLIKKLNKKYKKLPRIRFSFGIQSFDNQILRSTGRDSSFPGLVDFIRWLRPLKLDNNIFNLDFIAFGKFKELKNWNLQLRTPNAIDFFETLLHSHFIDSFSLYTLELFSGSLWYHQRDENIKKYFGNDDEIYSEFNMLKNMILENWYKRYEISNFSLPWKSSIHNRTYREHGNYIGIGTSAASFFITPNDKLCKYLWVESWTKSIRWKNWESLDHYNEKIIDTETIEKLEEKDLLIEEFFLYLRTDLGIKNIEKYSPILQKNYTELLEHFEKEHLISNEEWKIKLTDEWLDVYNSIITELLKEI